MKVAILAGGVGTRLAEETEIKPKPMVEIGGQPILWHIMSHYARYGHADFAVALGYKGDYIKRWFADFCRLQGSLSVDLSTGEICSKNGEGRPRPRVEGWRVDLVETGAATMTGGRIKRLAPWLGSETFFLTWGDGVADVDALGRPIDAGGQPVTLSPFGTEGARDAQGRALGSDGQPIYDYYV